MARIFSSRQRRFLFAHQLGLCARCGGPLDPEAMEADHITPWSRDGETEIVNGQLLCHPCHLVKGKLMDRMRPWQEKFVERVDTRLNQLNLGLTDKRTFFGVAPVGTGKTLAAVAACERVMHYFKDKPALFVPVCPSRQIVGGWTRSFERMPREDQLHRVLDTTPAGIPSDVGTYVSTYQGLDSTRELLEPMWARRTIIPIFDEVHHGEEERAWGLMAQVFDRSPFWLMLTATPFRTSGRIPGVEYDDEGLARADYTLNREDALDEGYIRHLRFQTYSAAGQLITLEGGGEKSRVSLVLDGRDEKEDDNALWNVIRDREYIEMVCGQAQRTLGAKDDRWRKLGGPSSSQPTCLIVCDDAAHAREVKKILERVTGEKATLVLNDIDGSHETIDQFRDRKGSERSNRYLISVGMVSEGCDIPHLSVGIYLSTNRTYISLDQATGRLVRMMGFENNAGPHERYYGTWIMPAHAKMIRFSEEMLDLQVLLKERGEPTERTREPGEEWEAPLRIYESDVVELNGMTHADAHSTISDDEREALRAAAVRPSLSKFEETELLELFRVWGGNGIDSNKNPTDLITPEAGISAREQADLYRSRSAKSVKRLAYARGIDHASIWVDAKKGCRIDPGKQISEFTLDECERVYNYLQQCLKEAA